MTKNKLDTAFLFLLIVLSSYLVGDRDVSVGTDTINYTNTFISGAACKCIGDSELGFELFLYPMYVLGMGPTLIFFIISLTLYSLMYLSALKVAGVAVSNFNNERAQLKSAFLIFGLMVMVPFVIQLHVNAIRQGLSLLCLLLSFLYLLEDRKRLSVSLLILAIGFHYSTILILPFYVVFFYTRIFFGKSFYLAVFIFVILSILYLLGFSELVVKRLSEFFYIPVWEVVSSYASHAEYKRGVRYDFYAFSFVLVVPIFLYALKNVKARVYLVFVLISMIPFLLLGWGAYSNRYVLNSWIYAFFGLFLYVVIAFPVVKKFYWVAVLIGLFVNVYRGTVSV
ncbi:EpsG family protein [Halopseudomonas pelagia]|uniref:EpsG family protein n=1 Tax=Halopseudomonas pelagia TaxID=553151 RepID=UPI001581533B|nr:EpsG family protein [Halopseudomonas pelagia]